MKSWLAKISAKFEAMSIAQQLGSIITASVVGVSSMAIMVPDSGVGRLLRADVANEPPSFSIDLGDSGEEDENAEDESGDNPPSFNIDLGDDEEAEDDDNSDDDPEAPCEENDLQNNSSEMCINGEYVICNDDTEGDTNTDQSYICEDDSWIPNEDEDPEAPAQEDDFIEIESHDATPEPFNPIIEELEIEFKLSDDAIIELQINSLNDEELLKLLDDKEAEAGTSSTTWEGTHDNTDAGTPLPAGVYYYKIIAKNTETKVAEDTEEGTITIVYESVGTEEEPEDPENDSAVDEDDQEQQDLATQVMTNTTSGETSATGPSVFIYGIIPLIGIILTRKLNVRK